VVWALVAERRLFVSADRGQTWKEAALSYTPFTAFGFSIIDSTNVWMTAGSDEIWRTTDGARSWRQLPFRGIPITDQCVPGTLDFVDKTHGFTSRGPTIYRTSDGGATWSPVAQLLPTDFPSPTSVDGISIKAFGNDYLALVRGHDVQFHDSMFVFRSSDGGAGWSYVASIPNAFVSGMGLVNVSFLTESTWVKILPGQSMETTDGGKTWHAYPSDYAGDVGLLGDVVFGDASVGYVTIRGSIQRTEDGGQHWAKLATPGVAQPTAPSIPMPTTVDLSAPSSSVVWALVAGQYLFRSTDQGTTWQRRTMPEYKAGGTAKAHIAFADDQDGWVFFVVTASDCGGYMASAPRASLQQGVQVYRTTDGAVTWTLVDSAVQGQVSAGGLSLEQCKDSFYFADPQHGFVGTSDATSMYVWRSSDGGVTWRAAQIGDPPGSGGRIISIQSFGSTVVLYAPGDVFQSTDGGATWTRVGGFPPPLVIVSPTRWLVIFPGSTSETLDAGKTWHDFTTDYHTDSTGFEFFVFATDNVAYGTDLGKVMRTLDGGGHWELIKTSWP
jgi:photosystem II stability/assembly factor-like uncharacterized protein